MTKAKRELSAELEATLEENLEAIRAYKRGENNLRTFTYEIKETPSPQEIRHRLDLSQQEFAARLRVSLRTLQDWEQGRRHPCGPAKSLLRIADQEPEVFLRVR